LDTFRIQGRLDDLAARDDTRSARYAHVHRFAQEEIDRSVSPTVTRGRNSLLEFSGGTLGHAQRLQPRIQAMLIVVQALHGLGREVGVRVYQAW
jgi:hypothetical protein